MSTATRPATAQGQRPARSRRRLAHLALVLVGLGLVLFGAWRLANPHITCRGVEMHPGDVCHKNGFSQVGTDVVQNYDERLHASRISQPVVIAMGALTAGFGWTLYRRETR